MLKAVEARLFLSSLVLCLLAAGCSTSSSSNPGGGGTQSGVQFTAPTGSPTIELGQSVNFTVNQPVTWTLQNGSGHGKAPGELINQTSTSATYVAPPLVTPPICVTAGRSPAPLQVAVVATSVSNSVQSANLAVSVAQSQPCIATAPVYPLCPPAGTVISPLADQTFRAGSFIQVAISDGGSDVHSPFGVPPFTWTISNGALPNGLVLSASPDTTSALIGGTPASAGCSNITLSITDATGVSASQAFGIVVIPQALSMQVPNYSDFYVDENTNAGIPYAPTALTVSGGVPPYFWTQNPVSSGVFPAALCLSSSASSVPAGCTSSSPPASSNTAMISGIPDPNNLTAEQNIGGPLTAQLQVNDSQQPYPAVAQQNLTMTFYPIQPACFPAQDLQPTNVNGGVAGAGSVPAVAYLQGTFAILMRGFDSKGPVTVAASVTTDGAGHITGGIEDIVRSGSSETLTVLPTGSSYSIGGALRASPLGGPASVYNRGCLTLANSAGTTTTFAVSLDGCSNKFTEGGAITTHDSACGMKQDGQGANIAAGSFTAGRIIEFDDQTGKGTRGAGFLRLQDASSFSSDSFNGFYAFGLGGWDSAGGHYAAAGSVRAGSGSLSAAAADIDDAGTVSSQLTGGSGTYNIGSNGRGTATLTIGQASFNFAMYMLNSSEAILVTTDPLSAGHPLLSGEAISTSGPFDNQTLLNSHIFHIAGLSSRGPDVSIGVLNFDGIGSLSGTIYENQAATLGTTSVSGAYSVDSTTGRTAFAAPALGQTLGSHPFVAYIIPSTSFSSCSRPQGCVTGFLVGTDSTAQEGILEFQTSSQAPPPPFTNANVVGDYSYGVDAPLDAAATNIEGTLSSNITSLSSRTQDASYSSPDYCLEAGCALLIPEETFTNGSFTTNSNGTGNFGAQTLSVTNGKVVFYIDQSPLNLHPTIVVAEQ